MLNVDLDGNATVVVHEPLPTEPIPQPAQDHPQEPMLSFHPPEPQNADVVSSQTEPTFHAPIEAPPMETSPTQEFQYQPPPFENIPAAEPSTTQEAPVDFSAEQTPVADSAVEENFQTPAPASAPAKVFHSSLKISGFMETAPEVQKPISAFKEIAEFASALTAPSLISYSIFIEGVESQRAEVVTALSDKKFGWSKTELEEKISEDRLILKKLNPAQAVMVVKLLQNIPIRISWRQDGL